MLEVSTSAWSRRRWIGALLTLAAVQAGRNAWADNYPSRSIRFIVPFTPGAGADTTARIFAQKLSAELGQTVVVENRGGASGTIGTELAAKAAPDGYTWVLGHDPAFTINPHLRKMPYDALKDFAPVSQLTKVPLALVANPDLPAASLKALIEMARKEPGKLTISSSGNGTSGHLAAEVFMSSAGIKLHHVPYRGQAEALTDVIAGRMDLNFSAIANIVPLVKSGKVRVLAIGAPKRFPGLPDVPTVAELGYPGFDVSAWHGVLMPAGSPAAVVNRVNDAISTVLRMPDVSSRLEVLGLEPVGGAPSVLARLLESDSARWGKVIRDAGIRAD